MLRTVGRPKLLGRPGIIDGHAADLLEKVGMEISAAAFAVSYRVQADLFLQLHQIDDGLVLDLADLFRRQGAALALAPGLQNLGRTQQTADLIGTERGGLMTH